MIPGWIEIDGTHIRVSRVAALAPTPGRGTFVYLAGGGRALHVDLTPDEVLALIRGADDPKPARGAL